MTLHSELLRQGAQAVTDLPEKELQAIQKSWLEAFCQDVKATRGTWIHNGYMWHAFSFDHCACLSGRKAMAAYAGLPCARCYAFAEGLDAGCAFTAATGMPDLTTLHDDFYVCAQDMSWTMAFTHEQPDLGPFFAKNDQR